MAKWASIEETEKNAQLLAKWSGLPIGWVRKAVLRWPGYYYEDEFALECRGECSAAEIRWWYRTSGRYLFHLASHAYWPMLDLIADPHEMSPVLDYGGGLGNNFFPLLRRGLTVHYFDISLACSDFVGWRIYEEGLADTPHIILYPFNEHHELDHISAIQMRYGAVIMQDVIEHIPDYEDLLVHLGEHMRKGGFLFEETYFGDAEPGGHVHLAEKRPLVHAMTVAGLTATDKPHMWRKV